MARNAAFRRQAGLFSMLLPPKAAFRLPRKPGVVAVSRCARRCH